MSQKLLFLCKWKFGKSFPIFVIILSISSLEITIILKYSAKEIQKKPIRRRRQKRKVRKNSSVTKTVEIEIAIASGDHDKLVHFAVSQLGLLTDKVN